MITIKCKIEAIQEGQYCIIVVNDLNRASTDDLKYVMVTLLPNWEFHGTLKVGEIGYLQFESVEAGKTSWFNKESKDFEVYKYSSNYFINFIKAHKECELKEFKFI